MLGMFVSPRGVLRIDQSHRTRAALLYDGFGQFIDIFHGKDDVPSLSPARQQALGRNANEFANSMRCASRSLAPYVQAEAGRYILSSLSGGDHLPASWVTFADSLVKSDGHITGAVSCILSNRTMRHRDPEQS
jgi:hypothetical protein